jgi:hypothetical protein
MKSRRLYWLLAALAATALLAAWGDAPVGPVAAAPSPHQAVTTERDVIIRALLPRKLREGRGIDPFAVSLPAAEAPPAAAATVPPAPTFSALPSYRVIGKQQEDGEGWTVFLARGEETWVVREGDILGDDYRVAAIKPPLLTLLHARNKSRRTIDIGEARE